MPNISPIASHSRSAPRSRCSGARCSSTASIGIAVADEHSTGGELVRFADTAAYRAKERGRNCYEVFDEALRAATASALETETGLHRALAEDQLVLHYQPIVDLESRETVGFEGLLRWQHPQRGLLGPDQFLSAAEASGLIVPIGLPRRGDRVRDPEPARCSAHARSEPLAP